MEKKSTRCVVCDNPNTLMAGFIGVCPNCAKSEVGAKEAGKAHIDARKLFGLPSTPPQSKDGVICKLCSSTCMIGEGEKGYCGLRVVRDGKIRHLAGTAKKGVLHWYRDPLPTNCVADWVCSGSTKYGKHNLAVFYTSCTLNCLFCQNWHYREVDAAASAGMSSQALADCSKMLTHCVCYFGGDPASQMPHALAAAKLFAEKGVTVCWETAGTANPRLMDRALQYSFETGGCVKFDLKAFTESLHITLSGRGNRQILDNFERAAHRFNDRPDPPLVVASTLLVPGYVDVDEVSRIAAFIAEINPDIPYALLGFGPNFMMGDLPRTSVDHAEKTYQAALKEGLRNVRIGNRHLLGYAY